ncbi:hypothetical protein MSSAC_2777 [Methanosarcina siciliae C2J]|uniref:Uncharacterized protein n=1 Tax=Methanosarcina siciliae C2J TaxID=1434118 RepID=A0A0E3PQT4_9EURY|nr:hypothetical protein [Methanosarcina siciliae]AKB37367.1 hypothetical protein MSSAC_2777 [Methanosarcina siciliae C2J]
MHPALKRIRVVGDTVTVDVSGKKLVLPTRLRETLIGHNEYTLDTDNIADLPWGGSKAFSAPPDNVPGTVRILSGDDCYLMPTDQSAKSKVLNAGYLASKSGLSVDTGNMTITEEFTIQNDSDGADVQVIDDCSSLTNLSVLYGTGVLSLGEDCVVLTGSTVEWNLAIDFSRSASLANGYNFILFDIKCSVSCNLRAILLTTAPNYIRWSDDSRFAIQADIWTTFVLPIKAPSGTTGSVPTDSSGTFNPSNITKLWLGVSNASGDIEISIRQIRVCNGTWVTGEICVPDELYDLIGAVDGAYEIQCSTWDVSEYGSSNFFRQYTDGTLDSNTGKGYYLDGTKVCNVFGSDSDTAPYGAGIYRKGLPGETAALGEHCDGPSTITYSENSGVKGKIGFALYLPPYGSGNPNLSKIQLKFLIYYDDNGKTTFEFSNDDNLSTGLQNLARKWIAVYDPSEHAIDYLYFTSAPKSLAYKQEENGEISEIQINPGNGQIYRRQMTFADLTADGDSDMIPDVLSDDHPGSLMKLLQAMR